MVTEDTKDAHTTAPASHLFFLSGIFASAAVNLLTGLTSAPPRIEYVLVVIGSALCWGAAALNTAKMAVAVESDESTVSRIVDPALTEAHVANIRSSLQRKNREIILRQKRKAVIFSLLGVAFAVGASLFSAGVGP